MPKVQLREVCGVRSGDKGDVSDLTLFMDDQEAYEAVCDAVTTEKVAAHFGEMVKGPVERHEVPRIMALKFVMHEALGGGGPRSLRSDNLGKTLGGALLRLEVDLPESVVANSARAGRRAPLDRTPVDQAPRSADA
ncbi:MAG: hypothetical protein M9942_03885 [Microthrixaceae bacterium]|nr:hypothetical protein [Microthrixaceae bacterium]